MNNFFRIITTPRCWLRNCRTDQIWDATLNSLLDNHDVKIINRHYVKIGGVSVWVANYPYAYGSCNSDYFDRDVLPKRGTVFRLYDAVKNAYLKDVQK